MTVKQRRDNSKLSFKKLKFLHNHHFAFLVIFLLLVIISINNIKFTGYSIIYVDEVVEEPVNLVLNSSYNYNSIIDIENFDHIKSLKLTGRVAKEGIVKVYFNDILVLDNSALVNSENKVTGLSILNETSVENIQDYILIDLDNYCLDSCNLFVNNSNVNLNFEIENSSLEVDEISYTVVKAENELESVTNSSEVTLNDGIVVEKDIEWTKIVELEEIGRVNVSLPSLARNIRVKKIVNDNEVEVSKDRYDIDESNLIYSVNPIVVNIYDDALKYKIYYDTPGPDKTESALIKYQYKLLKNISVSSELDLQNITSYVDLPNILKEQIKLRWFDENSSTWVDITGNETYNLTYYDSNYDGKFERVYWNIPHLSQQQFSIQIDLLILNVQSYPQVGGNWLVYFNTTGTADLAIEAIDGTTWSNSDDNEDLRFLELKCGNNLVDYQWVDSKVFVSNYNCDGSTGVEISKVISSGSHHLKFTFGNLVAFANNEAGGYGYNSTDNSFTDKDGLNFKADNNGIITIRKQGIILGRFGFGMTATFQGNNYNYTSENFNWTWSLRQNVNNYTFIAANNWSSFNWTQYYDFSPNTTVKIKHVVTNNFGAPLTNGKFWYIHSLDNGTVIRYNSNFYVVGIDEVRLQGNFNNIIPNITIGDFYGFRYNDLIDNNFDITNIYVGNGSLINHPNTLIMAVGVTKGTGTLPSGESVTLDPSVFTYFGQSMTANFIYTIAGNGTSGYSGDNVLANQTRVNAPRGVFADSDGFYIGDSNNFRIRFVPKTTGTFYGQSMTANFIYTIAGNGTSGYSGDNVLANQTRVNTPRGVFADSDGLYIGDIGNFRIRFVPKTTGTFYGQSMTANFIYTVAGDGGTVIVENVLANQSGVTSVNAVHVDSNGIYIADFNRIRFVPKTTGTFYGQSMTANFIYTVAGNGTGGYLVDNVLANQSWINNAGGVATDSIGFYIGDSSNHRIRFVPFTIDDPPNWSSPAINQTEVNQNQWINFSTIWSDDVGLSGFIFEINQSGNYVNSSFILFPTTGVLQNSSNVSLITSPVGTNVTWRFYANDTNNNWNVTALQSFIVTDTIFPDIDFINPTFANATTTGNTSIVINVSIFEANLDEVKFNWNGSNFTIMNNSLVLMMNFNNVSALGENATYIVDVSGNGNNGTATNGAFFNSTGKYDGAYSFDGLNDYISISGGGGLNNLQTGSIGMWVKWIGTQDVAFQSSSYGNVLSRQKNGAFSQDIVGLNGNNPDTAKIIWNPYTYNGVAVTSATSPGSGTWRHIVITFSSGSHTLYMDGRNDGTGATTGTINNDATVPLSIGAWIGDGDGYSTSEIDEVRVWNRTFSASEVYELYVSNLQKYNSTQWYLYVNQSFNSTQGLSDGTYNYFASAKDSSSKENMTDIRYVTISTDTPPNWSTPAINQTTVNKYDWINFTTIWSDGTGLSAYILEINQTGNYINSTPRAFPTTGTLQNSSNVTRIIAGFNANITWRFYANDTNNNWNVTALQSFIVNDTIFPDINFINPTLANATTTGNTSIVINVSIVEADLDEVKFNWNGTNYTIMNDSLVAMWNLNNVSSLGENNTYIVDMNKFGRHNLTVQAAAVSTVAGKYDGAFKFDGTANAYASKNGAVLSTFPMTYTAWVNPARIGTDMQWLWQGDSNTGPKTQGYVLSNGNLLCESSTDAISTVGSGVGVLTADNWYFVACVFNSTSSRIAYLNGQAGNWHTVTASPNMDQVSIGKALNGDFGRRVPFNGTIDEVRIYNKSLTQEEIQQLYFMNLQKYNSTQWYLYVNQSFNSTQGLSDGTYNYFASAKDTMGNENMTDIRYATIDATPPGINFTLPTPADGSVQLQTSVYLNTTITDISNVSAFFDWNYTLVGYWAMDWYNASGIYDNSSYNSFATFNGGQRTNNISAGKYGQGLNFNASNYYLDVPDRASLNSSALTIDVWVYSREDDRNQ